MRNPYAKLEVTAALTRATLPTARHAASPKEKVENKIGYTPKIKIWYEKKVRLFGFVVSSFVRILGEQDLKGTTREQRVSVETKKGW